jgi:hypothetical protein
MKDHLKEIVQHTHGLGVIDLVKVTGTENETIVSSISENRAVVVEAKFKNPIPDFIGIFGMPNLSKLNTILNISEYQEDAKISIVKQNRNGENVPSGIHFENKTGDFKNDYRFMFAEIINEKIESIKFKGVSWGVEVEPTNLSIQRLKFQASANNDQTSFIAKTEQGNLKFYFGDHSTHAGDFVFASDVKGSLSKAWSWPIAVVISILGLPGDKVLRFSDQGAAQITVDSGIAIWNYILPAQQK